MEMKKCVNGHFYDMSTNPTCPYCNSIGGMGANNSGKTVAIGTQNMEMSQQNVQATIPLQPTFVPQQNVYMPKLNSVSEGKTVALFQTEQGIDPVVGWLVCTKGVNYGLEYRLHADNNYIGRSQTMDVCIRGDEHVSRENQAIIIYDGESNSFMLANGTGRSIVRLNGNIVTSAVPLVKGDKISFGETEVVFVPLCGEDFKWEQ